MLKVIAIAAVLTTLVVAAPPKWHQLTRDYSFEQYLVDFGKSYSLLEMAARKATFEKNLASILAHNAKGKQSSYKQGVNKFTDMFESELKQMRGNRYDSDFVSKHQTSFAATGKVAIPSELDYRSSVPRVITAVKDQGMCGDCWAHAATEAIESAWAIQTGDLFVLSQQQVTSCTPKRGECYSCNGSYAHLGFDYVTEAGGLVEEWLYPFESYKATFPECKNPLPTTKIPLRINASIDGYHAVTPNNQDSFMEALTTLGPLAIMVDAAAWPPYEEGIFDDCSYAKNISLDHAVQAVGFGTDITLGKDYWIVRNSWAPSWGEHGFIRLQRDAQPSCGWQTGGTGCTGSRVNAVSRSCGCSGILSGPTFPKAKVPKKKEDVKPKADELTADYTFEQYKRHFGKSYPNAKEHAQRETTFARTLDKILKHNAQKPTPSYKMGVNHLTDLFDEELSAMRGGRYDATFKSKHAKAFEKKLGASSIPKTLDYRTSHPPVLTAVKDQGMCGDCWAHSVTEGIESAHALKTGDLFVLSQQQVTSCTPKRGSCYSCDGSFPTMGYEYAIDNGITEEWIYSFASYNGTNPKCREDPYIKTGIKTIVNVSAVVQVGPNDQEATLAALNELGPLGILVDASRWSTYESGIFDACGANNTNITLDHAVQLVGYGTDPVLNQDYWIVRNSWSPSFGEHGFIRLARHSTEQCTTNAGAAHRWNCYGTGPRYTKACGQCGLLLNPEFPLML